MWTLIMALVVALLLPAAGSAQSISIIMDGEKVSFDTAPIVKDGRTLVPLRGIFEEMGLTVAWKNDTRTATISGYEFIIELKENAKTAVVNGKNLQLDVPAQLHQQRMYVPLRFVSESVGSQVAWNENNKQVVINTGKVKDIDAFLEKLSEVETKSFSAHILLEQFMKLNDDTMNMTMDMEMDFVLEPFGTYQVSKATISDGSIEEEVLIEAYMSEKGFYQFDPFIGKWIKLDDQFVKELMELSGYEQSPTDQIEMMKGYMKNAVLFDRGDYYMLAFDVDFAGFQALFDELLPLLEEEGELPQDFFQNFEMEYVMLIDKESLFPTVSYVKSVILLEEDGDKVEIRQNMVGTYKNFNNVDPIIIPKEVIDSAITMEEALRQLPQ